MAITEYIYINIFHIHLSLLFYFFFSLSLLNPLYTPFFSLSPPCSFPLFFFSLSLSFFFFQFSLVQFSCSVVSDSCDPMNSSRPGLLVHHQLLESTQTHVHWVGDAIQPSHPLLSPSPPSLNLSQHQDLFKWVSSSHQEAKLLEFLLHHQSSQWKSRTDLL